MNKTHFENLRVYQLAERLADEIWNVVLDWKVVAKNTVGIQIIRSADSIGANIAEGSGRASDKDYKRFLCIARASLYETRHWLRRAYKRNLLSNMQVNSLSQITEELTLKLNAYIRSIGTFNKNQSKT